MISDERIPVETDKCEHVDAHFTYKHYRIPLQDDLFSVSWVLKVNDKQRSPHGFKVFHQLRCF